MLHLKLLGLKHRSGVFHQLTAKFGRRWVEVRVFACYVSLCYLRACVCAPVDELVVHLSHINYGMYRNALRCSFQADTQRSPRHTSHVHPYTPFKAASPQHKREKKTGLPLLLLPPLCSSRLSTCRECAPNFLSPYLHRDSGALQKLMSQRGVRRAQCDPFLKGKRARTGSVQARQTRTSCASVKQSDMFARGDDLTYQPHAASLSALRVCAGPSGLAPWNQASQPGRENLNRKPGPKPPVQVHADGLSGVIMGVRYRWEVCTLIHRSACDLIVVTLLSQRNWSVNVNRMLWITP